MTSPGQPVFIVGAPRSGTTWLLSMLEHHPQCFAVTPQSLSIKALRTTKETGLFLRGMSEGEIRWRFSQLPKDRVLVEKTPGHLLQVGRIKRLFPEARIVLVRRAPKDVLWSMIQENSFWEGSPRTLPEAIKLYNRYSSAQAAYYGFDAVVKYEELWKQPVEGIKGLLTKLGLDVSPAAELVTRTERGRGLPSAMAGVFRNGSPGQGMQHFSEDDLHVIHNNIEPTKSNPNRHSVLLAINHLLGWTGAETLLLTLIEGLLEAGCRVAVYARHWNSEWIDEYFDPRVRLTNDLEKLKHLHFDLAHVHHNTCLLEVRVARPTLPIVFSSLGVLPFLEQPVPFDLGVSCYLAISEEVAGNLIVHGVAPKDIQVFRNIVNDARFRPNGSIRERPERILVLSYKLDPKRRKLLESAATTIGASVRFVGGGNDTINQDQLPTLINDSDVVVSLGRGAVEAMLCARVPLVYDIHGGDGLVTPESFEEIRQNNFSGRRHGREYSVEALVAELRKYRPEYGPQLRELALHDFGSHRNLAQLLEIYGTLAAEPTSKSMPEQSLRMAAFCVALAREEMRLGKSYADYVIEVSRIKRTVSWRITAPLRAVWNAYKKAFSKAWSSHGRA